MSFLQLNFSYFHQAIYLLVHLSHRESHRNPCRFYLCISTYFLGHLVCINHPLQLGDCRRRSAQTSALPGAVRSTCHKMWPSLFATDYFMSASAFPFLPQFLFLFFLLLLLQKFVTGQIEVKSLTTTQRACRSHTV